jgi:hypothetical protein
MAIAGYSDEQFGERLQLFLRPSKPVKNAEMLHGRDRQLDLIRQALYADGRSIFIYGERGVGKSSLARISASKYRGDRHDFLYVLCEPTSTLESVLVSLAKKAGLEESEAQDRSHTFTARFGQFFEYVHQRSSSITAEKLIDAPTIESCVELAQEIVDRIGPKAIAVIDEFDTVSELRERQKFGDLIKRLGDRDINLKLILSGIGSSLDDLLGGHPSSIRQLHTVALDRLSWDARWEIVEDAARGMGVTIDENMRIRIAAISGGFPHYVHLVTEKLLWRMFSDPTPVTSATLEHYRGALDDAVESVAPQLKEPYLRATQRASEDYRDVVWAAADAYDLQRHTGRIFDSYVAIAGSLGKAPLERKKFSARLNDLKSESHGSIVRNLADRAGWYEFRENMVRGFVRLVAEQHGIELKDQSADIPKQLTARTPNIRPRQAYRAPHVPRVRFRHEPDDPGAEGDGPMQREDR